MNREDVRKLAGQEALKDWRFWFVYLASTFLFTQLITFFFQIDSFLLTLAVVIVVSIMMDTILKNHYTNVIAAEKGIKLD